MYTYIFRYLPSHVFDISPRPQDQIMSGQQAPSAQPTSAQATEERAISSKLKCKVIAHDESTGSLTKQANGLWTSSRRSPVKQEKIVSNPPTLLLLSLYLPSA